MTLLSFTKMTVTCFPLTSDPPLSSASADLDIGVFDRAPSPSPSTSASYDDDSDEDEDEEERNHRVAPCWQSYRQLFESHGYHLDTCKDVRQFYINYWEARNVQHSLETYAGYRSARREDRDENELCRDEGLPERLFRGKRLSDNLQIVIKAVHRRSRELDVITALSTPPLRDDPMNHCIPVLDIIHAPLDPPHAFSHGAYRDQLSFVIMEEWSSEFIPPDQPHTLRSYLTSLLHCIQHITFMHTHRFAHLDIAVRNVLTDYAGRYAYIDYETSRRFCRPPVEIEQGEDPHSSVLVHHPRATEVPPEVEKGHSTSPYAMDVWALGMLISKAGMSTGYAVPELCPITRSMLEPQWEKRPSAKVVLRLFGEAILKISEERLNSAPYTSHPKPAVPNH
ncbi:hypothetical protein BJ322DRAFT_295661 [Thelephora terrestris]|uniref:Protein kinase domain-containing protein n=1 Tax=Thelephora terrestris TaxID=56493 RepID=A0A9P6L2Y8_9AGAM|nr:hypothetical protein BJ322DRAFT_295661 [Thelephora terrestris]